MLYVTFFFFGDERREGEVLLDSLMQYTNARIRGMEYNIHFDET